MGFSHKTYRNCNIDCSNYIITLTTLFAGVRGRYIFYKHVNRGDIYKGAMHAGSTRTVNLLIFEIYAVIDRITNKGTNNNI